MFHEGHSSAGKARLRWVTLCLHLGFALTGIGTVLLGCILPRLSAEGHLRDKDAGGLLLVQFAAGTLGALLVRVNFWGTLAFGYLLISLSSLCIALCQVRISLLAFALLGVGLGMAMTSTSMLIGRLYPARKGSALAVLNLSWSIGAVLCPLLVARLLSHEGGSVAYAPLSLLAALFAFLPFFADLNVNNTKTVQLNPARIAEKYAIIYFALLAFLYVGIEATVGNWMGTYATREISWNFSHSAWAVSCFWSALLLGRAITPAVLLLLSERSLYRTSVLAVAGGLSLVLFAHSPWMLLVGTALTGLSLAPLFPLIISLFMAEVGESRNVGWVFAIAGLGGAVLSWLTGIISTHTNSLRLGLTVPAMAALVMAIMIFALGRKRKAVARVHSEPDLVLPSA